MASRTSQLKAPNRRQTLGPVTASSIRNNRRESIDVINVTGGGGPPVKGRPPRQSMMPRMGRENLAPPSPNASKSNNRRRSSGIGILEPRRQSIVPPSNAPSIKDSRPINDKTYQQQCSQKLFKFLLERGYEHNLTMKTFRLPSSKDFSLMITFMLRLVSPNFHRDGEMKFEDEVAMNLKAMGYPFPVSKTALAAAGSTHTWPTLLSMLTWLMERIELLDMFPADPYQELENEDETQAYESLEELELRTDAVFFKYLAESYTAFLEGDEERTNQLEEALVDRFERDDAFLEQEIERVTDLNATIVERMNNLSDESQQIEMFSKKREDYATDLEQFHDLIRQMDEHRTALAETVKERTKELNTMVEKIEALTAKAERLQKTIDTQELSVDDAKKIEIEHLAVKESLDRARVEEEKKRAALSAHESELVRNTEQLESTVNEFNSKLGEVALLPTIGKVYSNLKASVNRERFEENPEAILGLDIEGHLDPMLNDHIAELEGLVEETAKAYQEALDEFEELEATNKELEAKSKITQDKLAKSEKQMEEERQEQEALLSVRIREVEAVEAEVKLLHDPVAVEEQMAQLERQCASLEAMLQSHREENLVRKMKVQQELVAAYKEMEAYDEYVQRRIVEVNYNWEEKKSLLKDVVAPRNLNS